MRHPCRMAGGKRPVSRPAEERGLKPSLATTSAKASERVIADPPAWDAKERKTTCFPRCGKKRINDEFDYDDHKGVGRVIADLPGWEDARKGMEKRPVPRPSSPFPAWDAVSHSRCT